MNRGEEKEAIGLKKALAYISFVPLFILAFLILSLTLLFSFWTQKQTKILAGSIADTSSKVLYDRMAESAHVLRTMGFLFDSGLDQSEMENYFRFIETDLPEIENALVLDRNYRILYSLPYDPRYTAIDTSDSPLVAAASVNEGILRSPLFISPLSGNTVIGMALPLERGMILLYVDPVEIIDTFILPDFQSIHSLSVVDASGALLFDYDRDLVAFRSTDFDFLDAKLNRSDEERQSNSFSYQIDRDGRRLDIMATAVADLDWYVLVKMDHNEVYKLSNYMLYGFFPGVIIAGLVALFLANKLMQRFFHQLRAIRILLEKMMFEYKDEAYQKSTADELEAEVFTDSKHLFPEITTLRDIFEKLRFEVKEREEQLRFNEQKYRELFENTATMILIFSIEEDFVNLHDVNDAALRKVQRSRDNVIGYGLQRLYPGIASRLRRIAEDVENSAIPVSVEPMYYEDRQVSGWFSIYSFVMSSGAFVVLFDDFTELKESEREIQEINENLEELVRDRTEQYLEANNELEVMNEQLQETLYDLQNAQEQLVKREKMAVLGSLIAGVAHEVNSPLGAIKAFIENVRSQLHQYTEHFESFAVLPKAARADLISLIERADHVTELAYGMEARRRRRDVNFSLSERGVENPDFFADIFMDLNFIDDLETMMAYIDKPYSGTILPLALDIVQMKRSVLIVEKAVEQAGNSIRTLQSYVYADRSDVERTVDVVKQLQEAIAFQKSNLQYGIEVRTDFTCSPVIKAYPFDLFQVWTNLIDNAAHAMNYSGTLTIRLIQTQSLQVSFHDTGNAVAEEMRHKIFEPFVTTKPRGEGSGLGLDICRKTLETIGGRIFLAEDCKTFIVEIPADRTISDSEDPEPG